LLTADLESKVILFPLRPLVQQPKHIAWPMRTTLVSVLDLENKTARSPGPKQPKLPWNQNFRAIPHSGAHSSDVYSLYTMSIRANAVGICASREAFAKGKCDSTPDWTGKHSQKRLPIQSEFSETGLVERIGIEPMTLCLQSRCSPS
jgi:hypothetical protein